MTAKRAPSGGTRRRGSYMTKARFSSSACMQSRLQPISSRRVMALRAAGALTPYPRPVRKPLRTSAACHESMPDCRSSLRRFNSSRAENFSILVLAGILFPLSSLLGTLRPRHVHHLPSTAARKLRRATYLRQKRTRFVSICHLCEPATARFCCESLVASLEQRTRATMRTTCSFDAVRLCWMYRTLESFGEDAMRANHIQRIVSGKTVPKVASPTVTALGARRPSRLPGTKGRTRFPFRTLLIRLYEQID